MKRILFCGSKKPSYYQGILERADQGVHQQIADILSSRIEKKAKVLDLGAGKGALTQRLLDLGYDVTAADVDPNDYAADKSVFYRLDFNDEKQVDLFRARFTDSFDAVIGVEVIEHVENPWAYVRLIKSLLKVGGWLIISTPNVTSWLSRWYFLLSGRFHQFSDADVSYGHIAPITAFELNLILSREGFADISIEPAGVLPPLYIQRSPRIFIANLFMLLLRPFLSGVKDGWCIVAAARKEIS